MFIWVHPTEKIKATPLICYIDVLFAVEKIAHVAIVLQFLILQQSELNYRPKNKFTIVQE